jgi:PD-(D/E)XK nuclease superfamily
VLYHQELTERIIGLAIEVHRHSGPGLLESFYAAALCRELERAGIVILEIKAVPTLLPIRDMQLQTYLRMSGLPVGLLFNFHASRLKDGLRRFVE